MGKTLLFSAVFASQVGLVSLFIPWRATAYLRYVLRHCPPTTHPLLYPKPREYYERSLRNFMRLNVALVIAALAIIAAVFAATLRGGWDGGIFLPWSASGDWDAAIIVPFFLLQMLPYLYFDFLVMCHYKAMAALAPPRQRTAELHRRQFRDFISPAMIAASVLVYAGFFAFVLDYRRHQFSWFTAAGNIAGATFMGVLLAIVVAVALRARRTDHYEAHQVWLERLKRFVKPIWILSVAMPVLIAIQLLLKANAPGIYDFVLVSAFLQSIHLALRWPMYEAPQQTDFDVYRNASVSS